MQMCKSFEKHFSQLLLLALISDSIQCEIGMIHIFAKTKNRLLEVVLFQVFFLERFDPPTPKKIGFWNYGCDPCLFYYPPKG